MCKNLDDIIVRELLKNRTLLIFSVNSNDHGEANFDLNRKSVPLSPIASSTSATQTQNNEVLFSPKKLAARIDANSTKGHLKLESFFGLVNYYGVFIRNLAKLVAQPNELLCNKARLKSTPDVSKAFAKLNKLTS